MMKAALVQDDTNIPGTAFKARACENVYSPNFPLNQAPKTTPARNPQRLRARFVVERLLKQEMTG